MKWFTVQIIFICYKKKKWIEDLMLLKTENFIGNKNEALSNLCKSSEQL